MAGHIDIVNQIDRLLGRHLVEGLCLIHSSGEAIEDVAAPFCIVVGESFVDDADHDVVADKSTIVHYLLGHAPEIGSLADGSPQHVTRGDVRNDEMARQADALCSLTSTLPAEQNEPSAGDHAAVDPPSERRDRVTSGSPRSCAA